MSNEDLINFNFEVDESKMENEYTATDIQWIYINDLNNGQYPNGWVNWSNVNIIGASAEKYFDWKQGYVVIPHGVILNVQTGSFGTLTAGNSTFTSENTFAIGCKGSHHLVDLPQIKFAGAAVNRNSNYNNFWMNENLKKKTLDQMNILGDILGFEFDTADSYELSPNFGEFNNRLRATQTSGTTMVPSLINQPRAFRNQGHFDRMCKSNYDNINTTNSGSIFNQTNGTFTLNSSINSLQTGLVGAYDSAFQPVGVNGQTATPGNPIQYLVFQFVSVIPLCELSEFYKNLPSIQSSLGFELRTQLNCANNNSWTVNYTAADPATSANHTVTSIIANQSVGNSCPYMLSQAGVNNNTGLNVHGGVTNNAFSIRIQPYIGYYATTTLTQNFANNGFSGGSGIPCRIYVPQINYTPQYNKMILASPQKTILYNDYYIDLIQNQAGNSSQVTRLFNTQLGKVRQLIVLPYFSAKTNAPVTYRSPLSSAPTTVSFCRLSNFNIKIAGQNVLIEPLQYNTQFYINNLLPILGQLNGNSYNSEYISGQIKKSDWEKCYNAYVLDIRRVLDEVSDTTQKSFQLDWRVDTNNTYDFMVLIVYQNSLTVDRLTGTITSV